MTGTALIGRRERLHQIAMLRAQRKSNGETEIVRITGAPGVGKTALLDVVANGAHGKNLAIRAQLSDKLRPFATIDRLISAAGTAVVTYAGPSPPVVHDAKVTRKLTDILRLAGDTVVSIDDAHWCDDWSHQTLLAAVETNQLATLLIAERASEPRGEPWNDFTLHLEPLDRSAATQLVRQIAPRAPPTTVAEIVRAAGGVPFALALLSHALGPNPDDVDLLRTIRQRLEREPKVAEAIARVVAAYAGAVPIPNLAGACEVGAEAIAAALPSLSDIVVTEGNAVRFRHPAFGDVIRAYDVDSATTARKVFAVESASGDRSVQGLRRLRETAHRCGERRAFVDTSVALGMRLAQDQQHVQAADILAEAWHEDRELDGEVVRQYLDALRILGRDEEAVRHGRTAYLDAIARGDAPSAARIAGAIVHGLATLDRDNEITAFLADASSRPAIARSGEATTYLHGIALSDAAFDGNIPKFDALSALAPLEKRDLRADAFARALRGDVNGSEIAITTWRAAQGNWPIWDDALEVHRRLYIGGPSACAEWWERGGRIRLERGLNRAATARIWIMHLVAMGRWNEAAQVVTSIDPFDQPPDYRYTLLEVGLMLSALRGEAPGNGRRILHEIRAAIGTGRRRSIWASAAWWLAAHAQSGENAPQDIVKFVSLNFEHWPRPLHLAALPLVGVMARRTLSDATIAGIVAAAPQPGCTWLSAHANLANALLRMDPAALHAVRDDFEAMSAPGFAMIAGIALPVPRARDLALAERCGFRQRRHDEVATLTARERGIAELAADGCSNREIAEKLHIAERTVETHLTSVYRKLRVRTRAALGSRLIG